MMFISILNVKTTLVCEKKNEARLNDNYLLNNK